MKQVVTGHVEYDVLGSLKIQSADFAPIQGIEELTLKVNEALLPIEAGNMTKKIFDQLTYNLYVRYIGVIEGVCNEGAMWSDMATLLRFFGWKGKRLNTREKYRAAGFLGGYKYEDGVNTYHVKSVATLRKFIRGGYVPVFAAETTFTPAKNPARDIYQRNYDRVHNIKPAKGSKGPTKAELQAKVDEKDARIAELEAKLAKAEDEAIAAQGGAKVEAQMA